VVAASALPEQDGLKPRPLHIPGETVLPGGRHLITARLAEPAGLAWPPGPRQAYLDYDSLSGPLILRSRWPGARFHPQGAPGGKKLKDFFIDHKVPGYKRERYPLVTAGEEIVWVVGIRIGHAYQITEKTGRALVLELRKAQ
jgi:tRNA(Ile)-lysidine synthase